MAVDVFLKLDGIAGESQDAKHRNEIELQWWGWGVQQAGSAGGALNLPRTKGGKALFQDLSVKHRVDKASPKLIQACAEGAVIPNAVLVVRRAGRDVQEFLKIKLGSVTVSSVTLDADGPNDAPQVTVTLRYLDIAFEYSPQKADGTLDSPITTTCTV